MRLYDLAGHRQADAPLSVAPQSREATLSTLLDVAYFATVEEALKWFKRP